MTTTADNETPATRRARRRVTIEDVALEAGVSVATVSRALRNLPNVAVSTRDQVRNVARAMNFQPDPAASRLAAGLTRTITVGVPSLNGWYFSTVVAGAEAVSNDAGYEFQVIGIGSPVDRDRLLDGDHQLERRTDGLILVDIDVHDDQAASLRRRGVALATIGTEVAGHPCVRIDNVRVGEIAGEHLVGLGHRRLGLISGISDDPMNFAVPKAREAGFTAALRRADIDLDPSLIVNGNFGVDGGHEAMTQLLGAPDPPTAVFAMSDEMAFGALMALDRLGLAPGRDVSIMGVDDHEFSRVVNLTTIRQPVSDHGAVAARQIVRAMEMLQHESSSHSVATEPDVSAARTLASLDGRPNVTRSGEHPSTTRSVTTRPGTTSPPDPTDPAPDPAPDSAAASVSDTAADPALRDVPGFPAVDTVHDASVELIVRSTTAAPAASR